MSYTPGPLPEPYAHHTLWHERERWHGRSSPLPKTLGDIGPPTDVVHAFTASQMMAYAAAEVGRAVAAERERCAKLSIKIGNRKDEDCPSACAGLWPAQIGFAISEAIRADPQRLQGKGE